MKLDPLVGVVVSGFEDLDTDGGFDRQLLAKFARETRGRAIRRCRICRPGIPRAPRGGRRAAGASRENVRPARSPQPRRRSSPGFDRVGAAVARHRTHQTLRFARDANHGAEVHERLVEVEDSALRNKCFRNPPEMSLHRVSLGIAIADEHAKQHPRDVGVEDGRALPEREAANGTGRVRADPLNDSSVSSSDGSVPAVVRHRLARDRLQPPRPDVVPEGVPGFRARPARAPSASASSDGYLPSHSCVLGQHAIHLRLLQHDLGHENVVRVVGLAPRQIAAVPAVPRQQPPAKTPPVGAVGMARRSAARGRSVDASISASRARAGDVGLRGIPYNSGVKIYTRTGDAGETSLLRRHARAEVRPARRRLRRRRRAERLARIGPRLRHRSGHQRRARTHSARPLRAGLAPGRSAGEDRGSRDQGRDRRRRRRAARAADRPLRRGQRRRFENSSWPAARRPAPRCTSRGPCAGGQSAGSCRSCRRSIPCFFGTSIACPTCCSRWLARSTIGPGRRRWSGDHLITALDVSLTASNTARASSCDTRSRMAPHSTSVVPLSASMATSHRSRAMPSG